MGWVVIKPLGQIFNSQRWTFINPDYFLEVSAPHRTCISELNYALYHPCQNLKTVFERTRDNRFFPKFFELYRLYMIIKTTGGCNHLWLENILTGLLPRDLIFRMMTSNSMPSDIVSDPFGNNNRRCKTCATKKTC